MGQAILQIISDKGKAEQITIADRRSIVEIFTVQCQVKAVEEIYSSILGTSKRT